MATDTPGGTPPPTAMPPPAARPGAAAAAAPDAAAAAALAALGGETLPNGVRLRDWRITTAHTPILPKADMETLQHQLGARTLPEMTFGSALELLHEPSGFSLSFRAHDALAEWLREALPPIKVAAAADWSRSHTARLATGTIKGWAAGAAEEAESFDWTFTTPYGGTVAAGGDPAAAAPPPQWEPCEERIDREMLMARDPILFYDEVELYGSDLDDSGAAQYAVKLRVMPKCWYVLARFWLRVDDVIIRLRETRVQCKFGAAGAAPVLLRERSLREETFEQLRARGAPFRLAQYPDAETASQVLLAAGGPVTVTYDRLTFPAAAQ